MMRTSGFCIEMLFPVQSSRDSDSVTVDNDKHFALMKANMLMDIHFNN